MQSTLLYGNLRPVERVFMAFRNAEASLAIPRGVPVCYNFNGTNDGVDAVNSVTAGANACVAGFVGVNTKATPKGEWGLAQCYGLCNFVLCSGAVSALNVLSPNPAASNLVGGGALSAVLAVTTIGPVALPPIVTVSATATVDGVANVAKAFLRCM
jgi:hypothetical protein